MQLDQAIRVIRQHGAWGWARLLQHLEPGEVTEALAQALPTQEVARELEDQLGIVRVAHERGLADLSEDVVIERRRYHGREATTVRSWSGKPRTGWDAPLLDPSNVLDGLPAPGDDGLPRDLREAFLADFPRAGPDSLGYAVDQ